MPSTQVKSSLVQIGDAKLYYEIAGEGQPFGRKPMGMR